MDTGTVTFFDSEQGWGLIASPALPAGELAWVHFSSLDVPGYRELAIGQQVNFRYEEAEQDGYRFRATYVMPS